MGSTKGLVLISEIGQLVIKEMDCKDVDTVTETLIALEQTIIFVKGVQHLVLFVLRLTFTKHLEDLAVTHQSL